MTGNIDSQTNAALTCLLDLFDHVDIYETDNNKSVNLVCLDFQKEFDFKVPNEKQMAKVNAFGIQGDAAIRIRNSLAKRRLRVCTNQT